jgi:predicted RNase H-like nuclease (RuvC/YqgF family)
MKAQAAEKENWNCDKCRTEKVEMLQEELQNALRQIDELKARNRKLEAKLQMAGTGESDAMPTKQKFTKCLVVGDSIVRTSERNM